MKTIDASEAYEMVRKGGKLFIGRNAAGSPKVKIIHGPFGLFVSRFKIDEQQCRILKSKLSENKH